MRLGCFFESDNRPRGSLKKIGIIKEKYVFSFSFNMLFFQFLLYFGLGVLFFRLLFIHPAINQKDFVKFSHKHPKLFTELPNCHLVLSLKTQKYYHCTFFKIPLAVLSTRMMKMDNFLYQLVNGALSFEHLESLQESLNMLLDF